MADSRIQLIAVFLLAQFLLSGCGGKERKAQIPTVATDGFVGIASWYGNPHHGRRTANGERYDKSAFTAAHRTLPYNTLVQVKNLENGKQVKVRINDRGPFANNRIIDLSYAAAEAIGMIRAGRARVRLEVLRKDDGLGAATPAENMR